MTLHITTITPNHVMCVSDRLIATSSGYRELDNDRYKHLVLITDDARVVISFAGFAGIVGSHGTLNTTTIDWLTQVIQLTSSKKKYLINEYLKNIFNQASDHVTKLRKLGVHKKDLRIAFLISGWVGQEQFNYVIDNCLEKAWTWSITARDSFTARFRNYANENFRDGSYIGFLGNERLGLKQRSLIRILEKYAREENTEKIFDASVKIIRAASLESEGSIGTNCSGLRISRNDPGMQVFDARNAELVNNVVMPNIIKATSGIAISVTNIKGRYW